MRPVLRRSISASMLTLASILALPACSSSNGVPSAGDSAAPPDTGMTHPDGGRPMHPDGGHEAGPDAPRDTCKADDTPMSCGPTCKVCTAPSHATATCSAESCGFTCDSGYVASAGACVVPPAPRPIAPLSTSRVTKHRPTLRWALPSGVTQAVLDLCLDRACTKPIGTSVTVTGSSYAPTTDLPIGVVYWRLHSFDSTSPASATWEFTVEAADAAVDTSWGTALDLNGDGYVDIVVGAPNAPGFPASVLFFPGSAIGPSLATGVAVTGSSAQGAQLGTSVASAGDVNGDGFADAVIGDPSGGSGAGSAFVYLGSAAGITGSTTVIELDGPDGAGSLFGGSVASAGDVNGDGYADVIVGATAADGSMGRAYVYLGSASGLASTPTTTLTGPSVNAAFGSSVASIGDVNGDGYADVAIGAQGAGALIDTGAVYVYLGSASGLPATASGTLAGPDGALGQFGISVASAGDVNGDGYADLIVGASGASSSAGAAYVFLGSASGILTGTPTRLAGKASLDSFGNSVACAGDVNGDGYSDLIVGADQASSQTGAAYVFLGSAVGVPTTPIVTLTGSTGYNGLFGFSVAGAGDINGDGLADVVVGSQPSPAPGAAYFYLGTSGGTGLAATTPSLTLSTSLSDGASMGASVFGSTL